MLRAIIRLKLISFIILTPMTNCYAVSVTISTYFIWKASMTASDTTAMMAQGNMVSSEAALVTRSMTPGNTNYSVVEVVTPSTGSVTMNNLVTAGKAKLIQTSTITSTFNPRKNRVDREVIRTVPTFPVETHRNWSVRFST